MNISLTDTVKTILFIAYIERKYENIEKIEEKVLTNESVNVIIKLH